MEDQSLQFAHWTRKPDYFILAVCLVCSPLAPWCERSRSGQGLRLDVDEICSE